MRAAWFRSGHEGDGRSTDGGSERGRFTRSRAAHSVRGVIRPSPYWVAIAAACVAFGYLMAVLVGRAIG